MPQFCRKECQSLDVAARAEARLPARFSARVDKRGADDCWLWKGRRDANGYGVIDINHRPQLAHRVAYFLAKPNADQSLMVCHSCDNPPCCNPAHLWLGTQADNTADMDSKGRRRVGTRRGEASNKAKLTAAQALDIFRSSDNSVVLGARYGISKTAVQYIKRGKNWAHVTGAARNAS